MSPDDRVCLCFRVTRRKLEHFVRRERPKVASQLSECGGAGTGCGWCVPFLKQMFVQHQAGRLELETITAEEYAAQRAAYIRDGKGTPPAGSEPTSPDAT